VAGRAQKATSSRKRKLPRVLTGAEARALFDAPNLRAPTGLRNRCMLELMYRAGLRVGEVCTLKPRDVDLRNGVIRVYDGKGGDGTAYFDSETLAVLLDQWKAVRSGLPKSDFLFCTLAGGQVGVRYVQKMIKRMARRAGLDERVHPHMLRHTFATELLEEGFNIREVQEAMRHADISTTEIYTHVLDEQLRSKIQRRRRS
jgi:site-specific recombinase XerD